MKKYKRFFVGRGFENKKYGWISLVLDTKYIIDENYLKEKEIDLSKLFKSPYKIYQDNLQLLFTLYKNLDKNKVNVTHRIAYSIEDKEEENNNIKPSKDEAEKELYDIIKKVRKNN